MKKVMRKSKAKRKRPSEQERMRRRLHQIYALAIERGSVGLAKEKGLVQFVEDVMGPYRERGDHYFNLVGQIGLLDETFPHTVEELPGAIDKKLAHLKELQTDRLNYDDMYEALRKLHSMPFPRFHTFYFRSELKRKVLTDSGASDAFIGAPASDAGAMRRTLQQAELKLSEAIKIMDENTPRTAVMAIWEVIHAARAALKAVKPPNGVRLEDLPEEQQAAIIQALTEEAS